MNSIQQVIFNKILLDYKMKPCLFIDIFLYNSLGYEICEIAELTGLSRQTISKYMRKFRKINPETFLKLGKYVFEFYQDREKSIRYSGDPPTKKVKLKQERIRIMWREFFFHDSVFNGSIKDAKEWEDLKRLHIDKNIPIEDLAAAKESEIEKNHFGYSFDCTGQTLMNFFVSNEMIFFNKGGR